MEFKKKKKKSRFYIENDVRLHICYQIVRIGSQFTALPAKRAKKTKHKLNERRRKNVHRAMINKKRNVKPIN